MHPEVKFVPSDDGGSVSVAASDTPDDVVSNGDLQQALTVNFDRKQGTGQSSSRELASSDVFRSVLQNKSWLSIKKLVRRSAWPLNHEVRAQLWSALLKKRCGNLTEAGPELYDEYWSRVMELSAAQLPAFVHPHYEFHYALSERGEHTVTHLIQMIALLKPDVTYAPRLYPLISLFLHFYDPREVFELMLALLEKRELSSFVEQTRQAWDCSATVLKLLAAKFTKQAYKFVLRCSQNQVVESVDAMFENWMQWIFRDLPLAYLVRVMDCYMCEGPKILYRVGLALLALFHKHRGHGEAALGVHGLSLNSAVGEFCESLEERSITAQRLMQISFRFRGFSRKLLGKFSAMALQQVAERQARDQSPSSEAGLPHVTSGIVPHVEEGILSKRDLWVTLWSWLPARMQTEVPQLLYTSQEDGTSLHTLYGKSEMCEASIIIIKTTDAEILGAYCSAPWVQRHRNDHGQITTNYFGTGETFVFTLSPTLQEYRWVGLSGRDTEATENMFMAGDNTMLTVGGGSGFAFQLDENLTHGCTSRCDTFDNNLLAAGKDFSCAVVEVYKLR